MHSSIAELATLGRLFDEYRPRLLAMLERRIDPSLRARIDPQDNLQQAYLTAHALWPTISAKYRQQKLGEPGFSIYAWLYRLTLDTYIEAYRRESRQRRDVHRDIPWPEASTMQLGMGLLHGGTNPSGQVAREELREGVRKVVAMLKKEYRDVLWMRHNDQLNYQEIAEVLDITENNAMVRHAHALKKFKSLWEQLQKNGGSAC